MATLFWKECWTFSGEWNDLYSWKYKMRSKFLLSLCWSHQILFPPKGKLAFMLLMPLDDFLYLRSLYALWKRELALACKCLHTTAFNPLWSRSLEARTVQGEVLCAGSLVRLQIWAIPYFHGLQNRYPATSLQNCVFLGGLHSFI